MKIKLAIILLVISAASYSSDAESTSLEEWIKFSHAPESRRLLSWLRLNAGLILDGKTPEPEAGIGLPELSGHAGMFITLVVKGRVRGCYGAFHHELDSTGDIFLQYLKGALYLDPRYRPLERGELEDTGIIVTVTSFPEPADDPDNIDIARYGVFIECEGRPGTVVVPAEFRTVSGISSLAGGDDCRYSRFRAVTIR